jgi:hypothetical protein
MMIHWYGVMSSGYLLLCGLSGLNTRNVQLAGRDRILLWELRGIEALRGK